MLNRTVQVINSCFIARSVCQEVIELSRAEIPSPIRRSVTTPAVNLPPIDDAVRDRCARLGSRPEELPDHFQPLWHEWDRQSLSLPSKPHPELITPEFGVCFSPDCYWARFVDHYGGMSQTPVDSAPVQDRWTLGKRMFFRLNSQLRRAHRLFRAFPALPYRHFLDVGAYEGEFTDSVLSYFQPERVWLVEADPDQAGLLQTKYREESRAKVVPAAIADQSGTLEFHVNAHRPSSSLMPIASQTAGVFQKEMNQARVVRVPALSLDELFEKEELPDIDLMKVDIQGAERLLIQGGGNALKRIRLVFMEVWFEECYQGSALFPEIQTLMTNSGFKLRSFHEFRKGSDGNLIYSNALYGRCCRSD